MVTFGVPQPSLTFVTFGPTSCSCCVDVVGGCNRPIPLLTCITSQAFNPVKCVNVNVAIVRQAFLMLWLTGAYLGAGVCAVLPFLSTLQDLLQDVDKYEEHSSFSLIVTHVEVAVLLSLQRIPRKHHRTFLSPHQIQAFSDYPY